MKAVRALFIVLFNVAVVAPVAASPAVPAAAWPGVSDVLLNVAGPAPEVAWPGVPVAAWPVLKHSHVVGIGTPSKTAAWGCWDQSLQRLVAEFLYKDETYASTADPIPGIQIYHKFPVVVPDGCDTLYVTISAVGESFEDELLLTCKVDFDFCNAGFDVLGPDAPGWASVHAQDGDFPFSPSSIYYTWCTPITPGEHGVELRMASENGIFVALDFAHFYIDASYTNGGCVKGADPEDPALLHIPKLPLPPTPQLPAAPTPSLPSLP